MTSFADRLNLALDKAHFPPKGKGRQLLLAKMFDVSQQSAQKWLTGESYPDTKRISDIARQLDVHLDWLLSGYGHYHPTSDILNLPSMGSPRWKEVPIFTWKEGAKWEETIVRLKLKEIVKWVWVEAQLSPDAYALEMNDDSMVPRYMPHSIIVIDPHYVPDPGHIVIYYVERLKKVVCGCMAKDGKKVQVRPHNPKYKPVSVQPEDKYCGSIRQANMLL